VKKPRLANMNNPLEKYPYSLLGVSLNIFYYLQAKLNRLTIVSKYFNLSLIGEK